MALSDDAIIAMARDANPEHDLTSMLPFLGRFAALVAAKERDACKQDDDLILQMLGALEEAIELLDVISPFEDDTTRKARKAIAAARERLESKP